MENIKDKFCKMPWHRFDVKPNDQVAICCHGATGRIGYLKEETPLEIWNGEKAVNLRKSILEGTFENCIKNNCPQLASISLKDKVKEDPFWKNIIDNNILQLENPIKISHSNDSNCNLSCPSCRPEKILKNTQENTKRIKKELEFLLKEFPKTQLLNIAGNADPFASTGYRQFLLNFNPEKYPNLKFDIRSNGTMLTPKLWDRLSNIHNNINELRISIDAGTEKTYNKLRIGGCWKTLWQNIEYISKDTKEFQFCFDYVVQEKNFRELPKFIEYCKRFKIDGVHLQPVQNFGHWSAQQLLDAQVSNPNHKNFYELVNVMQDPIFKDIPLMPSNVSNLIKGLYVRWPMQSIKNRDMLYYTDEGRDIILRSEIWSSKNRSDIIQLMLAYPDFKKQLIEAFKKVTNHGTTF